MPIAAAMISDHDGILSMRSLICALLVTMLVACCLTPTVVQAQESSSTSITSPGTTGPNGIPAAQTVWSVSLGSGAALKPTYDGSNSYQASPVLFANINYDDMISLGAGGLNAYWHQDGLRIGGGLTVEGGRKDYRTNGLFDEGDDRLRGLGNIDTAVGLRAFATYDLGFMVIGGSVTKLTRDTNSGSFANMGVSIPYEISGRLRVSPHLAARWANRNYMQTHFGVTQAQAADSEFPEFSANSGFDDVSAGIDAIYSLHGHWSVMADATLEELTGDARKSPITFSSTDVRLTLITAYHF